MHSVSSTCFRTMQMPGLSLSLRVILYLTVKGWWRRGCTVQLCGIVKDWQIKQLKGRWLCHHFLGLAQKGPATFHIQSEWMNKEGGVRIEISHRDILLTFFFLGRPYLPTFSPVNMMMNNISWRAPECVSPGESPSSLCLLPMSSSFLCTSLFSNRGGKGGQRGGNAR